MARKIFLTGGTGFLGSHIARRAVAAGDHIVMLVRAQSDYRQLDATFDGAGWRDRIECVTAPEPERIPAWLASIAPEAVIHAAAKGGGAHRPEDIPEMISVNVTLGSLLLEGLHRLQEQDGAARRFVFCGSYWQHDDGGPQYRPNTFYASSKTAFEAFADYYRAMFGMRILGVKYYDNYGPNDLRGRAIDLMIDALSTPRPLAFSGGEQVISPLAIEDAVDAAFHALSLLGEGNPEQLAYAAPGAERVSLREIATLVEDLSGCKPAIDWGALPYRESQIFNPAILPTLPGWAPKTSLRQGVTAMLERRKQS